jgi:hypothetical protein
MIYLCIQWFAVSQIVWMIQMIKVQLNYVKFWSNTSHFPSPMRCLQNSRSQSTQIEMIKVPDSFCSLMLPGQMQTQMLLFH